MTLYFIFNCNIIVLIFIFKSSSKASKKKSMKLLNILTKPAQQAIKIPKSQKNNAEIVNDIESNEFNGSEDEDESASEITGTLL